MNTDTARQTIATAAELATGEARRLLVTLAQDADLDVTIPAHAHGASVALRMAAYQQRGEARTALVAAANTLVA